MTADKTGAHSTVTAGDGRYTIAVDGKMVGLADFADRGNQRVFYHTEIDPVYGGRGLATILVEEALNAARDEGKRVVPVCSMVVTVLKKHPEYDDITDPVTATSSGGWRHSRQVERRRRRRRKVARSFSVRSTQCRPQPSAQFHRSTLRLSD
jgi:uncharacterized protein